MAEVLASLKKIGGSEKYTETVLWTNPDPSSSFAGQNVTLSDSIGNYKYMKITWKTTTSDTAYSSAYVLVSDLASMTAANGNRFVSISCMWTNVYKRNITYNSATSIGISTSYRENASGSNNGVCIPLEILGVNELSHTPVKGEIVYLGQGYSANTSALSITLNDSLSNYAYIAITLSDATTTDYIPTTSATYPIQIMANVEYFKHNNVQGYFVTGSSGSATYQTATYSYVDDTHITAQKTISTSRTYYVYGIK